MLTVFLSCSDDKSISPVVDNTVYPILYHDISNDLLDRIITTRDTFASGNYSKIDKPIIIVEGVEYDFYEYTSTKNEDYFKSGPFLNKIIDNDSISVSLFKRSVYLENTNNLLDSILRRINTSLPTRIFEGNLYHRSQLAISLIGRKNTITTEREYVGKERVDIYFLEKVYLNEPLEK